jgi:shikimate 5-dehydrogenase
MAMRFPVDTSADQIGGFDLAGPVTQPTLYFIGVSTARSSIMRVFPRWADVLGLEGAVIRGIDLPLHAPPEAYRRVVAAIKHDPWARGALVTTHKLDLFAAAADLFDEIDPLASVLREASCLTKRNGRLIGQLKDPLSSSLALDAIVPKRYWLRTGAGCFAIGAGGAALAISVALADPTRGADRPSRLVISDRDPGRLAHIEETHRRLGFDLVCDYREAGSAEVNDVTMRELSPGSLVINATGLGKDLPGSPLSDAAIFPFDGFAWDLNYRGDLVFLTQARRQAQTRRLNVHDGWCYFIHGWTLAIADVFDVPILSSGAEFDLLSSLAAEARG